MCHMVVTVTSKGYMRKHTTHLVGQTCSASGLSIPGAETYISLKGIPDMPLTDPEVGKSEKFSDHFKEGEPFYLLGIRTVEGVDTEYGKGTMILLKVRGTDPELGIWGKYLMAQAGSADASDMNKWYAVNRRVIPGFGSRPVKVLDPHDGPDRGGDEDPGF